MGLRRSGAICRLVIGDKFLTFCHSQRCNAMLHFQKMQYYCCLLKVRITGTDTDGRRRRMRNSPFELELHWNLVK